MCSSLLIIVFVSPCHVSLLSKVHVYNFSVHYSVISIIASTCFLLFTSSTNHTPTIFLASFSASCLSLSLIPMIFLLRYPHHPYAFYSCLPLCYVKSTKFRQLLSDTKNYTLTSVQFSHKYTATCSLCVISQYLSVDILV